MKIQGARVNPRDSATTHKAYLNPRGPPEIRPGGKNQKKKTKKKKKFSQEDRATASDCPSNNPQKYPGGAGRGS